MLMIMILFQYFSPFGSTVKIALCLLVLPGLCVCEPIGNRTDDNSTDANPTRSTFPITTFTTGKTDLTESVAKKLVHTYFILFHIDLIIYE